MHDQLRFTLLQPNLAWEDPEANYCAFEAQIAAEAAVQPLEIVLLPEMFATGFSMNTSLAEPMDGPSVEWMRETAKRFRCILGGSLMIRDMDGRCFNRFIWMHPTGEYRHYDKRHLFGYGGEDAHFTAGDRRVIVQVKGWKICLQVCYDLRFPVWSRNVPGEAQYDVLVYIASWPARRVGAWDALLLARAIENQSYVIGLNRTGSDGNDIAYPGHSGVYGPDGTILWKAGDEVVTQTLTLERSLLEDFRQQFPFLKDGDGFVMR